MIERRTVRIVGYGLLQAGPVLIVATFMVFALLHLVPGDLAITLAGESATHERIEEIRALYGLDRSILVQYGDWLSRLLRGDLSVSHLSGEPVLTSILRRLPTTLFVVSLAMMLSLVVGIPLGIAAARRPRSLFDTIVTTFASLGIALPSFWLAMILISLLAMTAHWFPVSGMLQPGEDLPGALWHSFLPATALAASGVAEVARQTRSALL